MQRSVMRWGHSYADQDRGGRALARQPRPDESLWPVLHWFLLVLAVLALPGSLPPPQPLSMDALLARDAASQGESPDSFVQRPPGSLRLASLTIVESVLTASLASVDDSTATRYAQRLRDPGLQAVARHALPPERLSGEASASVRPVAYSDDTGKPATDWSRLAATGAVAWGDDRARPAQIAVDPKLAALAALADEQARSPRPRAVTAAAFPKWTSAQGRYWAHDPSFASVCNEILSADCGLEDWRGFLDEVAGRPPAEQLALVNGWVNRVPYRADQAVWGERDYWAAPGEFLAAGGDCEDYAIAKYYSLKDLGFPEEAMRIVVLNDKRRREPHAVLVVEWQGEELVLDSLDRRIRPWAAVRHYHAVYSFNADAYWLHAGRKISKT